MKHYIFLITFLIFCLYIKAQETPFIKLVELTKEKNTVYDAKQFIIGSCCKTCAIDINGNTVKVYNTGAFALEVNIAEGRDTNFVITATTVDGKKATRNIGFNYTKPLLPTTTKSFSIESIKTMPDSDLLLTAGDKIQFKVKAFPGCKVSTINGTPLYEMPTSVTKGMAGIYQGEYTVRPTDNFISAKIPITIANKAGQKITKETENKIGIVSSLASDVCYTKGRLAHLEYGIGEDRLGGAKIGYIDSMIPLKIIGKVGVKFKVALTPFRSAYIPENVVELAPRGTFAGPALTERWRVSSDGKYDYVSIGLSSKLPYHAFQEIEPNRIIVDIFGATCNTNWITQLQNTKEVKSVQFEQKEDGIFRAIVYLKNKQHWGHSLYFDGNKLVLKIKQQPKSLSLSNLKIAIDAGHGGSNGGAGGATGSAEKNLTLAVSLRLQDLLEAEGTKVLMTRTTEAFVDNKERILMYRDNEPDLLVSIHLNSSEDPINVGGTGSFYKYIGFKNLSYFIHKRMLQLGLKEYGHVGAFNFMLNGPTEYPNALVETLFISNLEEEAQILDPTFQQKMAEKILAGIKDFLQNIESGK